MEFEELTEEQLQEYVGSLDETEAKKNALLAQVQELRTKLDKTGEKIDDLAAAIGSGNFDSAANICIDSSRLCGRLSSEMLMFPNSFGYKDSYKKVRRELATVKDVIFEKKGGAYLIRIPELLPHKMHTDYTDHTMKYIYDIDAWRASYYEAFAKEFQYGKINMSSDKVSICYLLHIPTNMQKGIPDTDNYDTKVMTDIISEFILYDDGYRFCNYFVDVIPDDALKDDSECYTQIIVCNADRREELLKIYG